MRLQWLPAVGMAEEHFDMLCRGGEPGGWSASDIAEKLLSQQWLAFACPGGAFAVEKRGTRLHVQALCIEGFGFRMRAFRDVMDRLASDMGCDTVETTCFNERLARAMRHIRARTEAWTMVWQVEGKGSNDGQ